MKEITSLTALKKELNVNDNVWLLLYKKGSEQSDCAFDAYKSATEQTQRSVHLFANVLMVRDIHPEFGITSVPTLLQFKKGVLVNLIKGCRTKEHFIAIFENSVYITPAEETKKQVKRVIVYSTPTCTWCNAVKRHLAACNVSYREIDVSKDQKAAEEMVRKSGQQGVPQLDINGQIVVGFDRIKINTLLGIN